MEVSNSKMGAFYAQRDAKLSELRADEDARYATYNRSGNLADLAGQDVRGAAYITSIKSSWDSPINGGKVCGIWNLAIVAKRITEGSHRLSTAAEIAEFTSRTKRDYQRLLDEDNLRGGKPTHVVIEAAPPTKGAK